MRKQSLFHISKRDALPLGKALLGKKVGDVVHVQVNANVGYDVEIKALKNTEDDGDKIRSF
jgi:transcription elongation factor GreA